MDEDGRGDGIPERARATAEPPLAEQLVEHLIEAREIAIVLDQSMLRRLIEAVMLEAGRTFAKGVPDPTRRG